MLITTVVILVWFVVAFFLSFLGWLNDIPSAALFLGGLVVPVGGYAVLYLTTRRFRSFVLSRRLRSLTLIQAVRIVGGTACFWSYSQGLFPASFAYVTGVTDLMWGATSLIAASVLVSDSDTPKKGFVGWHLAGFLALVASSLTGALTSPMGPFPFSFIPTFLGPIVLVSHLMACNIARSRIRTPLDQCCRS